MIPDLGISEAETEPRGRNPWAAGALGLVFPGLGHVYLGRWRDAALACGLPILFAGLVLTIAAAHPVSFWICGGAALLIQILAVLHAIHQAPSMPSRPNPWTRHGGLLFGVGLLLSLGFRASFEFILPSFRFHMMKLPGRSMSPMVRPGARFIFDTRWYASRALQPGEVVGFRSPEDPSTVFMKRCVAVAGEVVQLHEGVLYIDGKALSEPYLHAGSEDLEPSLRDLRQGEPFEPMRVPDGTFFCLGDERENSLDSRIFGPVPLENLTGKVLYVWYGGTSTGLGQSLDRPRTAAR